MDLDISTSPGFYQDRTFFNAAFLHSLRPQIFQRESVPPGGCFSHDSHKMENAWTEIKGLRYRTFSPLLHAASAGATLAAGCPGTPSKLPPVALLHKAPSGLDSWSPLPSQLLPLKLCTHEWLKSPFLSKIFPRRSLTTLRCIPPLCPS